MTLKPLALASISLLLAGCARDSAQLDETGGLRVVRSTCPAVAVPAYTGDLTVFSPPQSRDARAVDVVAAISNLRVTCDESGETVRATATFDVSARRASAAGAREVVLPYFATVVRGGTQIMSKQESRVAVRFADGALRATASGQAGAEIARALASLPTEVSTRLNRRRKASDADASVDPMTDPKVRAAVGQANFELLVGFQLTQDQLGYNATR